MPTLQTFLDERIADAPGEVIPLDDPVPLEDLPTPALLIDLDRFEKNLSRMQTWLEDHNMGLRCHTKMHKCPVIAHRQIELGATGVCAAKVSEAEILQANGVDDILITSPVVTDEKIFRVIRLAATSPGIQIVIDNEDTARRFDRAAREAGIRLGVLIDLDPAMGRTGIEPGEPALALARTILDSCPGLVFGGLQMYAGHCMHIEGFEARRERYLQVMEAGRKTLEILVSDGIEVPVFTGGGTGTWNIEPDLGLLTDLQAGSYAFMDIEYYEIGGPGTEKFEEFEPALFVLVTAISQPQDRLITVDGGFKSFASDKMVPRFLDVEGVIYHWGGDEHGIIELNNPSREICLGDKLPMLIPHCDPTVNLHDYYYPFRDGVVKELWPVTARGWAQ